MNKVLVTEKYLENIGKAIRAKTNSPTTYTPKQMAGAIGTLPQLVVPLEEKQINFIDYDGTLLHAYTKEEINAMTSLSDLPQNPYHDGLIAQGWNWTLALLKARLSTIPDYNITVGQMYNTESGGTELFIEFDSVDSLTISFFVNGTGSLTVDWGDNSILTYTINGIYYLTHTYSTIGKYIITYFTNNTSVFLVSNTGDMEHGVPDKTFFPHVYKIRLTNDTFFKQNNNYGFYSATSITIPKNIAYMPAVSNCYPLLGIVIPSGITQASIESNYSLKYIACPNSMQLLTTTKDYNITLLCLPGATTTNNYSYSYMDRLKKIYIKNTTNFGNEIFRGCDALVSVIVSNTLLTIGLRAFYRCGLLSNFTIPNSVTSIGSEAFRECDKLTNIIIPNSVTSLGLETFYGCDKLTSVTLSNQITNIPGRLFYSCDQLNNIIIPNSVTSIETYAFAYCLELTNITLSSNLLTIGFAAFYGCIKLNSISIPNGVTLIRDQAFYNCQNLSSIIIPNTVTTIGSQAFYGCNITSVTIPSSVTELYGNAFGHSYTNNSLVEIHCQPTTVPTKFTNAIFTRHPNLTLYVPSASLNAYREAMGSSYESQVIGE